MQFLIGRASYAGTLNHHRHISTTAHRLLPSFYTKIGGNRRLGTAAESNQTELGGENAYDLLGVSETSSFAEIKASFRKLAKETHPDLAQLPNSERFIRILAAYEILSDGQKRANYDRYLLSQKVFARKSSGKVSVVYTYELHRSPTNQMDVVEWLRWYRYALHEIVSEKRVVTGSSYLDELERDFYSAVKAAYYGPLVDSMDLLPDCFEAEERSSYETTEVLHLVSGRDLFGIIRLADKVRELQRSYHEKLIDFKNKGVETKSREADSEVCWFRSNSYNEYQESDAYRDLELHISGHVVAVATRVPPKSYFNGIKNDDLEDHIHIFLSSHEDLESNEQGSRVLIGKISGLGTSSDEDSCFVYDYHGEKTHVIMKHRTLLVKHMHWYEIGDKVSVCECRCTRARLPPSRYWLFEPRCGMHDIGGWYVETYGKDTKDHNVPSKRYWNGFDEHFEKRLHPAIYLLALAYRTLDLEDAKRKKQHTRDAIKGKLFGVIGWCKNIV